MKAEPFLLPVGWQPPPGVRVALTQRAGGVSTGRYVSFNLGDHVGDDPAAVARNRGMLTQALGLPHAPQWLTQVHGTQVVDAREDGSTREGDAVWTDVPGLACAILTADCLPVVIASRDGREVAVAHCGWRGLAGGVLASTVARFRARPAELRAWMGPAIGPTAFEVGEEVRAAFLAAQPASESLAIGAAFAPLCAGSGKFRADLYALARIFLRALGVEDVGGGGRCTFLENEVFFSYRRDGVTGRMATLVWIDPAQANQPLT